MGSVIFKVYVDDKEVFNSGKMIQTTPAKPVHIKVAGVEELRLVVTEAGDGITCDVANWADAYLISDPKAKPKAQIEKLNIAPFGETLTWDANRTEGTKANRLQEFPLEDLFTETAVLPKADGTYEVPVDKDGKGCIGTQWMERRRLTSVGLEFAGKIPSSDGVIVQYWMMGRGGGSPGGSKWQGRWVPLVGKLTQDGNRWSYLIDWTGNQDAKTGALKVRWIFSDVKEPIVLSRLIAYTDTRWRSVKLKLESEKSKLASNGDVEIYNGEMTYEADKMHRQWDTNKSLDLSVTYSSSKYAKTDRTVLRFKLPSGSFGVAVDDVIANGCVYVREYGVYVALESAKENMAQYKRKIALKKTVLESVRVMKDQTFERAISKLHKPVQDLGPTILSLSCDNRKFIEYRDGSILFDNNPDIYNCADHAVKPYVIRIAPTYGSRTSKPIKRYLDSGWMPIQVVVNKDNGVTYTQRTYVAPYTVSTGVEPLGVAEITAENSSSKSTPASIKFAFTADTETNRPATVQVLPQCVVILDNGKVIAAVDTSGCQDMKVEAGDGFLALSGNIPAKSKVVFMLNMPRWELSQDQATAVKSGDQTLAATKAYWQSVMAPAMQIQIPDPLLENVIKASQVYCLLAARNKGEDKVAPWIDSLVYGPLESEAQSIVRGMAYMGHTDFARKSNDYFISRYTPEGFLTTGYTMMGTGIHLSCVDEYYELTKDSAWLKRVAPEINRACRWIMAQRLKTQRLDAQGKRVPEYGLMPPGALADWEVYAYYFYANSYYCAGLEAAGKALKAIDYPGALEIVSDAAEFKAEINRVYRQIQSISPVRQMRDGNWILHAPTHMLTAGPVSYLYPGEDFGRSWCYDVELGANHMASAEVIDPNDKEVGWMVDLLEDIQFLESGWFAYPKEENHKDWYTHGGFAKVQPYYTRVAEIYALRDDVKPFIRTYMNTLPTCLNLENLTLWEHFNASGGWNKTHETGHFLCQTRLMYVMERGDELWLAPFVTNNWMKNGMEVLVKNAPTRFGEVSYSIKSHVSQGFIEAKVELTERSKPGEVVLRIRHPEGKLMQSATVNGKLWKDFDAKREIVRLRGGSGLYSVRVGYTE